MPVGILEFNLEIELKVGVFRDISPETATSPAAVLAARAVESPDQAKTAHAAGRP
jgi:hypothetical protein